MSSRPRSFTAKSRKKPSKPTRHQEDAEGTVNKGNRVSGGFLSERETRAVITCVRLVNLNALVLCFSFISITNAAVILIIIIIKIIQLRSESSRISFFPFLCVHKEEVNFAAAHTQYKSFASVVFQLSWTLLCCFSAWRTSTSGTWSCWATRSASSRVSTT